MSKKGKFQKVDAKKPLGWKKILLIVLAVVVVLVAAAAIFGWNYFKGLIGYVREATYQENELSDAELEALLGGTVGYDPNYDENADASRATAPHDPDYGEMGKIVNIMLIGQAYRKGEETKLSDTMILCTLNRETNTLTMTSFLRDLYVQLPNYKGRICGMQRMNVCYNLGWVWAGERGGMEMLDLLVYNNFGVDVDYNIEINFEAVVAIVDMIGGVKITLNEDEAAYMTDYPQCEGSFEAGENLLAGDAALVYARMRKSNAADNDFNRTARQRNLITQIIKKCTTMSLSDLNNLLKSVLPMILTDMTEEEILEMTKIAISMLTNLKIESAQCPAEGTYWGDIVQIGGYDAGVIKCDVEKNKEILMALAEADVLEAAAQETN